MQGVDAFRHLWGERPREALISVHRGLWGEAPENSVKAIAAASAFGIVEIDVQIARDGVPVVIHDANLQRTAGVNLVPQETGHAELTAHRLLKGAGGETAKMSDQFLPTLEQAIEAAGDDAFFDFDVKYPSEVKAVGEGLKRLGVGHIGSLKIDTRTDDDVQKLLDLQDKFDVMVMAKVALSKVEPAHIATLVDAGVAAAEVSFDDVDQLAKTCEMAGEAMAISTYTLDLAHCCGLCDAKALKDPDSVWGTLLDAGVTIIMTDQAEALRSYMGTRR